MVGLNATPTTMRRYSRIEDKLPREFLLLQGRGCRWRKCTFCDYYGDTCENPYDTNKAVIEQITGEFGVVDIINSGSAMELDEATLNHLARVVKERNVHTIWFEAHYLYREQLKAFAARFEGVEVKFRCGVESFDAELRTAWNKGIDKSVTAEDVARYFRGVCLLCCTVGDSRERILRDIDIARRHFEYFSINLFCNNTTTVRRDEELAAWFEREVLPTIEDDPHIEVLLNNTDLGVGE